MTMYQPGIPTGTVNLDVDYQNIQNNFQQLDTTYGVNHIPYSQATNNGYHTLINMVNQSSIPPATVVGTGELYTFENNDGFDTDNSLFYQTQLGKQIRLTNNIVPVTNNLNGYTFLPGGLIYQWGIITVTNATTVPVVFATSNKNFPNACLNIQVSRFRSTASDPGTNYVYYVDASSVSTTGFNIINRDGHTFGYYWTAIGF